MPRGPCIVYGCNNVGVHQLPKEQTLKTQWISAAKLDTKLKSGRSVKTYTYFCSDHFKDSDFYHLPPLFNGDTRNKKLKNNSIPSIFPWTKVETTSAEDFEDDNVQFNPYFLVRDYSKNKHTTAFADEMPCTVKIEPNYKTEDPLELSEDEKHFETINNSSLQLDVGDTIPMDLEVTDGHTIKVEVDMKPSIDSLTSLNRDIKSYSDVSVQTVNITPAFSVYSYRNYDKAIQFYTGLETYKKMLFVFTTLGDDVNHLKYVYGPPPESLLDPLEQFFLILVVLWRHTTFEELSMMYLISIKDVSNLVITWIRFMSLVWKNKDLWVEKETVKSYMPFDFNDVFPLTRVIIGATECPKKNKNKIKFVLGITPTGLITYVSSCYEGSTSDRQVIERSDNLNTRFDPQEIMTDIGLNVHEKTNMPSFFKKGNQIESERNEKNRKIASKRIHIVRTIGIIKSFKILVEPMNKSEIFVSSDIVFVCAVLTNFNLT